MDEKEGQYASPKHTLTANFIPALHSVRVDAVFVSSHLLDCCFCLTLTLHVLFAAERHLMTFVRVESQFCFREEHPSVTAFSCDFFTAG